MANNSPSIDLGVVKDKMLQYKITHVFCPLQLPDGNDHSLSNDRALSKAAYTFARAYAEHLDDSETLYWQHIVGMLRNLDNTISSEALDIQLVTSQLQSMAAGGK